MKNKYTYITFLFGALLFWSCSEEDDIVASPFLPEEEQITPPTPNITSGSADFSTYVAVGNSLTAGFSDGALFQRGQAASFPNILAGRMALAGGGVFTVPQMNDDLGGLLLGGNQIAGNRLIFDPVGQTPVPVSGTPTTEITNVLSGPFNNMGVPGAKSYHLLANGYGSLAGVPLGLANPYYARMASSQTASIMEDVMAQSPTFFSLWIGANDVLSYATSGGVGEDHNATGNVNPATYAGTDITNAGAFAQIYNGLVATLTSGGAKGFLVNIPSVEDTPFFTTVPNNALNLTAEQAASLTGFFRAYAGIFTQGLILQGVAPAAAQALAAQYAITFNAGPNRFLIKVPASMQNPQGFRQMTEEELLLLTIDRAALAGEGYGSVAITPAVLQALGVLQMGGTPSPEQVGAILGAVNAIDDADALDADELASINQATTAFNATIAQAAQQFDLPMLDANAFMNLLNTEGLPIQLGDNPARISSTFVTGGAFSLDGVHPSPRGHAVVANLIMELINEKYGSNLPRVNPVDFTGVYLN